MKVGLIDIEPKVVNTALVQIAYHHRHLGDTVEWAAPLCYSQYDKLYCSSLFTFTDKREVPARAVRGGTGFDLTTKLPFDCEYDYSIYPECDFSVIWFSRGCIRDCPFCVVQQKEGRIRRVKPKQLNPNGRYIKVQDNNFFANPEWITAGAGLLSMDQPVTMEGVDVRILTAPMIGLLGKLKHEKQIKIAWDNPKEDLTDSLKRIVEHIKPYRIMCYVLIGYWSTPAEDFGRVMVLRDLGIDPFVMPYDKDNPYQKRFARWVNHKAIFKSVKWADYSSGREELTT